MRKAPERFVFASFSVPVNVLKSLTRASGTRAAVVSSTIPVTLAKLI
jgi:hypothetical protein